MPHAGYAYDDFRGCLRELRAIILDGQRRKFKCIIGGDFNTEIGRGQRSAELLEVVCELGMRVCNHSEEDLPEQKWTFRSCLGRLRQLDYVIAEESLELERSEATGSLHLGSDHRAVQARFSLPRRREVHKWKQRPNRKNTDWAKFGEHMGKHLASPDRTVSLEDLEEAMNAQR